MGAPDNDVGQDPRARQIPWCQPHRLRCKPPTPLKTMFLKKFRRPDLRSRQKVQRRTYRHKTNVRPFLQRPGSKDFLLRSAKGKEAQLRSRSCNDIKRRIRFRPFRIEPATRRQASRNIDCASRHALKVAGRFGQHLVAGAEKKYGNLMRRRRPRQRYDKVGTGCSLDPWRMRTCQPCNRLAIGRDETGRPVRFAKTVVTAKLHQVINVQRHKRKSLAIPGSRHDGVDGFAAVGQRNGPSIHFSQASGISLRCSTHDTNRFFFLSAYTPSCERH